MVEEEKVMMVMDFRKSWRLVVVVVDLRKRWW